MFQWRGGPTLEALVVAFRGRPSVRSTEPARLHPDAGGTPVGKVLSP